MCVLKINLSKGLSTWLCARRNKIKLCIVFPTTKKLPLYCRCHYNLFTVNKFLYTVGKPKKVSQNTIMHPSFL